MEHGRMRGTGSMGSGLRKRFATFSASHQPPPWLEALLILLLAFLLLFPSPAASAVEPVIDPCEAAPEQVCESNRIIPRVEDAFRALTHHGEWMGFRSGDDAPIREEGESHIQGIARSQRPGVPYLFVVSAGKQTDGKPGGGYGESDANLMVVRLDSRDTSGERLRSNRLKKTLETDCTSPPYNDRIVKNIRFRYCNDADASACETAPSKYRYYNHPGNLVLVGDILAIPFYQPSHPIPEPVKPGDPDLGDYCVPADDDPLCDIYMSEGKISFYDVSNPEELVVITELIPVADRGDPTKVTRLAPFPTEDEVIYMRKKFAMIGFTRLPDGHFLLLSSKGFNDKVEFWRSNNTSFFPSGDPDEEPFAFKLHTTLYKDHKVNGKPVPDSPGMEDWKAGETTYQACSFINQDDGRLFMAVGRNLFRGVPYLPGDDRLSLFEVTGFGENQTLAISKVVDESDGDVVFLNDAIHIEFEFWGLNSQLCTGPDPDSAFPLRTTNANMGAGGSTYISPSGELLYYAVEHYNWGPQHFISPTEIAPSVRFIELRHQQVVRDGSPTHDPSADPGSSYLVNEGDSIELDGSNSRSALAAPWAQLFEYGEFQGQSVMYDWADRYKDDFEDFGKLDTAMPLDLCYDVQKLDDGRVPVMAMIEDYSRFTFDDFMTQGCLGTYVDENGECYLEPPIIDDILNASCKAGCDTTYVGCVAGCPASCVDNCGVNPFCYDDCISNCENDCSSFKTSCKNKCDFGIKGKWIPIPDIHALVWAEMRFEQLHLPPIVQELGEFLETVKLCGRLGDFKAPPPPLPDFKVLTLEHYGITSGMTPFEVAEVIVDIPKFVDNVKAVIKEFNAYPARIEAWLKELYTSLDGFNNRASSVRWYAPDGVDIKLYDEAGHTGGVKTLRGSGSVIEIDHLYDYTLSNGKNADDAIRSMKFRGDFTPEPISSHLWSIDSLGPYSLINDASEMPTFDATLGDGPETVKVTLQVMDTSGRSDAKSTSIEVLNVNPVVQIDTIHDESGATVYDRAAIVPPAGTAPILLEALVYDLAGSFSDAGIPDTHTATFHWGDGDSNSDMDAGFSFIDTVNGEDGYAGMSHLYRSTGANTILLEIEDDDGGIGKSQLAVEVVDAARALEIQIGALEFYINAQDDPDKHLLKALDKLRGKQKGSGKDANDGKESKGALGRFLKGKPESALERIKQALRELEKAGIVSPSPELDEIRMQLVLLSKSSAVSAILEAEDLAYKTSHWKKIAKAREHVASGDAWRDSGLYCKAVEEYKKALHDVNGI